MYSRLLFYIGGKVAESALFIFSFLCCSGYLYVPIITQGFTQALVTCRVLLTRDTAGCGCLCMNFFPRYDSVDMFSSELLICSVTLFMADDVTIFFQLSLDGVLLQRSIIVERLQK